MRVRVRVAPLEELLGLIAYQRRQPEHASRQLVVVEQVVQAAWCRDEERRRQATRLIEDAIAKGQQATRNYAKRQYTWFRRQPPEDWPRLQDPAEALAMLE